MSSKGYEYVKNSRHNLKRRLLYIMGDKCCLCGYNKATTALEFHHINPEEKDFTISANANTGFEKSAEELRKCILVCANCHREIHEGLIKEELISSFDEEKYKEISQEVQDMKARKIQYCKKCGKIISKTAEYCIDCFAEARRTVERPTREELKDLIRNKPIRQVGIQYGVADNTIRKWCDKYNLPRKKEDINAYSDEEWEKI